MIVDKFFGGFDGSNSRIKRFNEFYKNDQDDLEEKAYKFLV